MEKDDQKSENQSVDLNLLKKEVDALQIAIHGQRAPWYKNASIILSVTALLFSFVTTGYSIANTQGRDIETRRSELLTILLRLSVLPREHTEIIKKYGKNEPLIAASLSSSFTQENTLLARQAVEIVKKLSPEYVSATQYYAIGLALQNAYDLNGAIEQLTKSIDISHDMNDKLAGLRTRANLLFMMGQAEKGRVDYQSALSIFSDSNFGNIPFNGYTKKSTHIQTELSWAYSELGIGKKDLARQHILNAESHLVGLIPSPGADQLKNQISRVRIDFQDGSGPIPPFTHQ